MKRFVALLLTFSLWGTQALCQEDLPESIPTPPPTEISPELFPSPTPIPSPTASPLSSVSPEPSSTPSAVPTPTAPMPTASPEFGAGPMRLEYSFPKLSEGQVSVVHLQLKGNTRGLSFPIKGQLKFEDRSYDQSQVLKRTIPFVFSGAGLDLEVPVIFQSAGKKTVRIETELPQLATRNVLAYVEPLPATVFPRELKERDWSQQPKDWHVWVNLYHSNRSQSLQRQYYMVTYKGEVVQKLLTSSAIPGMVTPQGNFHLGTKMAAPRSTKYDSLMPFWTTIQIPGFSFEYGNHGLLGESYLYHLGSPASHGCLRLSNKWIQSKGKSMNIGGAKWVYNHVPVGTPIEIFRRPAQPFAFENYQMWLSARRN